MAHLFSTPIIFLDHHLTHQGGYHQFMLNPSLITLTPNHVGFYTTKTRIQCHGFMVELYKHGMSFMTVLSVNGTRSYSSRENVYLARLEEKLVGVRIVVQFRVQNVPESCCEFNLQCERVRLEKQTGVCNMKKTCN
ncbi:hypothetical protein RND81_14G121100 [Saponaria officinalis]|uniref:Uncharacterized protein n=1 Tax=Saponaria officinalis TaxID=3572 RepID=A0AAW1GKV4_SAPOF